MTFEQFKDNLEFLQLRHQQVDAVDDLLKDFTLGLPIYFPFDSEMESRLVQSMERELADINQYISYFVYEVDFGKNAQPDSIVDSDGTPLPIQTIEDLWILLGGTFDCEE